MPGDYLGDVPGQAVEDGVGDEDSTEVVRGVVQRGAVGLSDQAGARQGIVQQCADTLAGDALRFGGDAALEQQPGRRHPDVFVVSRARTSGTAPPTSRIRQMIALSTSASSGLSTSNRSASRRRGRTLLPGHALRPNPLWPRRRRPASRPDRWRCGPDHVGSHAAEVVSARRNTRHSARWHEGYARGLSPVGDRLLRAQG
jgi:hypothetical protein